MEVFAQKRLKFSGSLVDQSTVRFGSGAVPRLLKSVQITEGHLCHHVASVNTYTAYWIQLPR